MQARSTFRPDGTGRGRRPVLGWREWVCLPDLGIVAVKAKVDTGARSSALHALEVQYMDGGAEPRVRFTVCPLQHDRSVTVTAEAALLGRRSVRSAGRNEIRAVIATRLAVMGLSWPIELTLTDREPMGFRMLLGRQAVRRRFVVDAGRSFLAGTPEALVPGED